MKYWQGVAIETYERVDGGNVTSRDCRATFSNRSLYVGPRASTNPSQAMDSHMDLGCGYKGHFNVTCRQVSPGVCMIEPDISTCKPPTYEEALTACYSVPTTTTRPPASADAIVEDWLGVEDVNDSLAELPTLYNITTQTTTPFSCCEVHVGAVCRPDQNFKYPAPTKEGRWQPEPSYKRQAPYFAVVPCDRQAKNQPRKCPRVRIKEISLAYLRWPQCRSACSTASVQAHFMSVCNRTKHPQIEEMEQRAHRDKIASMSAKAAELEAFVAEQMATVKGSKDVIDCFADDLPNRFNSLKLPKMRTGFEKMPLHNECRLHGCKPTQCLEITRTCKVPFVHEAPEVMCNVYRKNGTYNCIDKVGTMSNSPMSVNFGIIWFVVGGAFGCAGLITFVKQLNKEVNPD